MQLTVLLILACFRLTRFAIIDTLFDGPRRWIHRAVLGREHRVWRVKVLEGLDCGHCLSVWFAASLVAVTDIVTSVPAPGVMFLAVAGGTSLLWSVVP